MLTMIASMWYLFFYCSVTCYFLNCVCYGYVSLSKNFHTMASTVPIKEH